ncbi:hypothetical protein ABN702_02405 [Bacillus haimaensis]
MTCLQLKEKSFIAVMKDFFMVMQSQKVHHKADEGLFHDDAVAKSPS